VGTTRQLTCDGCWILNSCLCCLTAKSEVTQQNTAQHMTVDQRGRTQSNGWGDSMHPATIALEPRSKGQTPMMSSEGLLVVPMRKPVWEESSLDTQ